MGAGRGFWRPGHLHLSGTRGVGHGHLRPLETVRASTLACGRIPQSIPSCFLASLVGRGPLARQKENVPWSLFVSEFWIYLSHWPVLLGPRGIVRGSSVWSRSLHQLSSVARLVVREHPASRSYLSVGWVAVRYSCHHVVPPVLGRPTCRLLLSSFQSCPLHLFCCFQIYCCPGGWGTESESTPSSLDPQSDLLQEPFIN